MNNNDFLNYLKNTIITRSLYDGGEFDESLNLSKTKIFLNIFSEWLRDSSKDEKREIAKDVMSDIITREIFRRSTYYTIDRCKGINQMEMVRCLGEKRDEFSRIVACYQEDFDFWRRQMSDIKTLPIWNTSAIDLVDMLQDEYIDVAEIMATYYTCVDNETIIEWNTFLCFCMNQLDGDAKETGKAFSRVMELVA